MWLMLQKENILSWQVWACDLKSKGRFHFVFIFFIFCVKNELRLFELLLSPLTNVTNISLIFQLKLNLWWCESIISSYHDVMCMTNMYGGCFPFSLSLFTSSIKADGDLCWLLIAVKNLTYISSALPVLVRKTNIALMD